MTGAAASAGHLL